MVELQLVGRTAVPERMKHHVRQAKEFIHPVRRVRLRERGRAIGCGIVHIQGDGGEIPLPGVNGFAAVKQMVSDHGFQRYCTPGAVLNIRI